ncbi:MAG: hypothetical protein MUP58_02910, partial [Candidatus Nanohaloarchaeota archaeon QJJ-9]|nr:hypothetical protein [Candidatus Nanohaloarchaeota archaeon QJJ-9]
GVSSIYSCVNDSGNELLSVDAQAVGEEGVSASPTLMINGEKKPTFRSKDLVIGEQSFSPDEQRSPEAYKAAICSAFEEKPDACNMNLSTEAGSSSGTC